MNQKLSLALLFVIGALLVVFSNPLINGLSNLLTNDEKRITVASITAVKGDVKIKEHKSMDFIVAQNNDVLRDKDSIFTAKKSKAILVFKSGYELVVLQNSSLIVENQPDSGSLLVTILQGRFKILKKGPPNRLIISENSNMYDVAGIGPLKALNITKPAQDTALKSENTKSVVRATPKTSPPSSEGLSDSYIASVVQNQKPFFNRCYAQHLKNKPNSQGQIQLAFTIQPSGKVSSVNILNSTIDDKQLQVCTVNVVERFSFKAYTGQPMVINYPLIFE